MIWHPIIKLAEENPKRHFLRPPCSPERIQWLESLGGRLPESLQSMLRLSNGGELFVEGTAFITILAVLTEPPEPALTWPIECCIDYWLPEVRSFCQTGWPIARSSYGSMFVMNNEDVREWERGTWSSEWQPLSAWIDRIIQEGKQVFAELGIES